MKSHPQPEPEKRPANKATADQPAEEFIAPDATHHSTEDDSEHGDEAEAAARPAPISASNPPHVVPHDSHQPPER